MSRKHFAAFVDTVAWPPDAVCGPVLFPVAKRAEDQRNNTISVVELETAAYARGFNDGQGVIRAEIEQLGEIHRNELQTAVEAARQDQIQFQGAELASRLIDALAELEAHLVERVRPVLQVLLEAALVERAVNELGQILRRAIAQDGALEMTIFASANLVEAVKKQLPAGWDRATFVAGEEAGIRVAAGGFDVRVELDAWRDKIAGGQL